MPYPKFAVIVETGSPLGQISMPILLFVKSKVRSFFRHEIVHRVTMSIASLGSCAIAIGNSRGGACDAGRRK